LPYHQTEIEDINVSYSSNNADNSKHARRLSLIIQHFWNRRKSEYLTPLRELHKKHGDNKINIKVGDTVQIHDDKPRNTRKTGIDGLYDQLLSEQIMYSSVNGRFRVKTTEVRRVHVHSSLLGVTSNQNASQETKSFKCIP